MSYEIEKVIETCPCGAQISVVSRDPMFYIDRFHRQHEGCIQKNVTHTLVLPPITQEEEKE